MTETDWLIEIIGELEQWDARKVGTKTHVPADVHPLKQMKPKDESRGPNLIPISIPGGRGIS